MAELLEIGKNYKISGFEAVCVGFTKKGYAKMQTLGMTHGKWPGEGDISNYNDVTRRFTEEWKGVIKKFRLPTIKRVKKKEIRTALAKAAESYSSFGASNNYSWLGTPGGSGRAYDVSSGGNYSSYGRSGDCVVAPKFNLNTSKVILDGDEIKKVQEPDQKREYVIVNNEHNSLFHGCMLFWGSRTDDNEKRSFGGYTSDLDACELYTKKELKESGYNFPFYSDEDEVDFRKERDICIKVSDLLELPWLRSIQIVYRS